MPYFIEAYAYVNSVSPLGGAWNAESDILREKLYVNWDSVNSLEPSEAYIRKH